MPEEPESQAIEWELIDLHLGRLEPIEALRVEQAIADSPQLTAQSRAIAEVFALLDRDQPPDPPADLAEMVIAGVNPRHRVIPFPRITPPRAAQPEVAATSPVLSLRELIAIAACITLFVGVFVPGYFKAQNIARRNLCRENLRQIWGGMASYAQENNGYVSYAGFVPNGSWMPTRVPNIRRASNTQHVYLLLRGGYVRDAHIFICPSTPHSRSMLADDYREFQDFAEPANITYSFQFMNLPHGRRLVAMNPLMGMVADRNPFLDGGAIHRLDPYAEDTANSVSHEDGAGQNVIYVSGQGGWFTQPTIGVDQDNIYQAGHLVRYQGTEQPVSSTDTFLVN